MRKLAAAAALIFVLPLAPAVPAGAETSPQDVPVTPQTPLTAAWQQPSLDADPLRAGRLAVAYRDASAFEACHLGRSTDGGAHWTTIPVAGQEDEDPLFTFEGQCSNPMLAYGPNGTLHYTFGIWRSGPFGTRAFVYLASSADGGETFSDPVRVSPEPRGSVADWWPQVVVDQTTGRVHVVWFQWLNVFAGWGVLAAHSDDGRRFSDPVHVSPPSPGYAFNGLADVGGDGTLYVSWIEATVHRATFAAQGLPVARPAALGPTIFVASSTDGGETFGLPSPVAQLEGACSFLGGFTRTAPCDRVHVNGDRAQAIAAGDDPGEVYLSWWDSHTGPDENRIFFSSSEDAGRTWTEGRAVGIGDGMDAHQQHRSWLSVAPDGRIDLVYYDLSPGELQDTYLTSSEDGGDGFSAPLRLNEVSSNAQIFPPAAVGPAAGGRFGAFPSAVSTDDQALAAWTDSRRGTEATGHQDVYFASRSR